MLSTTTMNVISLQQRDLRVARPIPVGSRARVEVMVDVLNVLNDTAEENLVTDTQ